ncbi:MAG: YwaF family protein [Clostridium perfringens]|nr:YwaF family protein [Clostridium perfringens]
MEGIRLFFINQENNYIFNLFGKAIIISIVLLGCYIIIKNSNSLRKNSRLTGKINTMFAYILILQQVFLTIENIILGKNDIFNLVPCYLSRMSIILLIVALLTNERVIKNISCYLGFFIGAHFLITNNFGSHSYLDNALNYLGYIFLIWGVTCIISIDSFKLEKKILKNVLILTNAYCVFLIILSSIFNLNYNIISGTSSNIYEVLSKGSYIFLVLLLINGSVALSHILIRFVLWEIDVNFKLEFKTIIEKDKLNKAELE